MEVSTSRRPLRYALLATLLAAGSAHASVCISVSGSGDDCGLLVNLPVEQIQAPVGGKEVVWPNPTIIAIETPRDDRRDGARGYGGAEHRWTHAEAMNFVHDWWRQHERDFEDFRRDWHRGHHEHHGHGGGDDDLPKPVPLPGAALLFAPALLMLRAFQRRNA